MKVTSLIVGCALLTASPVLAEKPLTSVTHDATLTGNGTTSSPLGVAPPAPPGPNNDLCVAYTSSSERVIAKDFGNPPGPNKCKSIAGFMLPFFSESYGTICTSADGQTMHAAWQASSSEFNAVSIWNADIALPLPNTGTGSVLAFGVGSTPTGSSNQPFNAAQCSVAVP
jgi:hypothetical protein